MSDVVTAVTGLDTTAKTLTGEDEIDRLGCLRDFIAEGVIAA